MSGRPHSLRRLPWKLVPVVWGTLGTFAPGACSQNAKLKTVLEEFVFEEAPFRQCHASTIVDLPNGGLLAAWFGGDEEGHPSVEIWLSHKAPGGVWSAPRPVTNYLRDPCWNPVLFRDLQNRVWLFFKVGPDPMSWVGAYRKSEDGGENWSEVKYLPAGVLGPIRSKPIRLSNGDILAGTSVEAGMRKGASRAEPYWSWTCWVNRSSDGGATWTVHGPIVVPGENYGIIQPTLWESRPGVVKMLLRATRRIGYICESTSADGGKTWTPATPTTLPNPNSGIDAVKLRDGRVALVYNHTASGRTPLNLAVSDDDGKTWGFPNVLEDGPGEFSYPAAIQGADGLLHITYTWKRKRIKHVVVNPADIRR